MNTKHNTHDAAYFDFYNALFNVVAEVMFRANVADLSANKRILTRELATGQIRAFIKDNPDNIDVKRLHKEYAAYLKRRNQQHARSGLYKITDYERLNRHLDRLVAQRKIKSRRVPRYLRTYLDKHGEKVTQMIYAKYYSLLDD